MRLYGIRAADIVETIQKPDLMEKGGRKTALKKFNNRFSNFPLKVIYLEDKDELFVISAYPLKKPFRRHKK